MDVSKLIRSGDFCEVVTDKFIHEDIKRGNIIYVAGAKALPIEENDPYTQRIKFFCHLVKDDVIDTSQLYLMDALSIMKTNDTKQKKLTKLLRNQMKEQLVASVN